MLLYLHPDPGGRRRRGADDDPPTALKVVESFFGKRKETIREDIELLREHNDAVDRRRERRRVAAPIVRSIRLPHRWRRARSTGAERVFGDAPPRSRSIRRASSRGMRPTSSVWFR